jgi:hypothetical protein
MKKRSASLLAAAALATTVMAVPMAPSGAQLVPDVVANPGAGTIEFQSLSINIAGQELNLPKPTDPPQCSNGSNDDIALDEPDNPAVAQDQDIDFPADPECSSADDNSEVIPGFQPKNSIVIDADVAVDGVTDLTASSFPPLYVWVFNGAGFPLQLDFAADVSGLPEAVVDPAGPVSVELPLSLVINAPDGGGGFFPACDTGVFGVSTSTDPLGPNNAGPIPVAPVEHNTADGFATVTSNMFLIPSTIALIPDPGIEFFCNSLNASFGLPSAGGNNAATITFQATQTADATPYFAFGEAAGDSGINGTVEDGGAPLPGMYVALYSATSTGRIDTAVSAGDGSYSFTGINPGRYKVRAYDPTNTYPSEYYMGETIYARGDVVVAPSGGAAIGIDFDLGVNGDMIGVVSDDDGFIAGAQVRLYTPDGYIGRAFTDAGGVFIFEGLPPRGDYAVKYVATGYTSEWFDDVATYKSPGRVDIVMPAYGPVLGIDAMLAPEPAPF